MYEIKNIKIHHSFCYFEKKTNLDENGLELFLLQNIVTIVSWFESCLKQSFDSNFLKGILLSNGREWEDISKKTYLKLLELTLQDKNFSWEIESHSFISNKKIILFWSTFYKDYLLSARNRAVHDMEILNKINNNEAFLWFCSGIERLSNEIEYFLNN